jgi:hypothetical protein
VLALGRRLRRRRRRVVVGIVRVVLLLMDMLALVLYGQLRERSCGVGRLVLQKIVNCLVESIV